MNIMKFWKYLGPTTSVSFGHNSSLVMILRVLGIFFIYLFMFWNEIIFIVENVVEKSLIFLVFQVNIFFTVTVI